MIMIAEKVPGRAMTGHTNTPAPAPATSSTHRSVLVRGTHKLLIRRHCTQKAITSRGFRAGGHLWAVSYVLDDDRHLASVSLELLHTDAAADVVAMATLRIEHPCGGRRRATWRSDDAHVFSAWPSVSASARSWELELPDDYRIRKEHFVDGHGCFYLCCAVDVLQEDSCGPAAEKISVVPPPTISSDLGRLLVYPEEWEEDPATEESELWRRRCMLPDVTFVVEHAEIQAHKLVLAMRSPVFAAEFRWHATESTLHVHDMSASTFRAMLHFIYTDDVALTTIGAAGRSATLDLLVAADRYDIGSLRLMCENILSESLDVASVMPTLRVVHGRPSCQWLEALCIKYMASDPDVYAAVKATEDYKELKESCCYFILEVTDKVAKINMTNTSGHDAPSSSSSSRQRQIKESTEVLEAGTHKFKIPHFIAVQRKHGVDKEISSDTFQVGGYDWKVKVYPSSSSEADEGHISVYAELLTDTGTTGVRATLCFTIDDPSGLSPPSVKWLEKTFTTSRSDCGYAKFITMESAKSHNLADDGSLTVHCDVSVMKKVCTSTSTNADGDSATMSPCNIVSHLKQLLVSGQGADMRFLVEGIELKAHSLLIATRSQILYEAVAAAYKDGHTIKVNDVTVAVFKAMLHFIYTDELPPVEDLVHGVAEDEVTVAQGLLVAACSFRLDRMKTICENLLATFISKENASTTLELAHDLHCLGLRTYCIDFMVIAKLGREGCTYMAEYIHLLNSLYL